MRGENKKKGQKIIKGFDFLKKYDVTITNRQTKI